MDPYRELATSEPAPDPELRRDDRILASLVLGIGGLRVILAVALGETFGTEVTIAAVMMAIGGALLLSTIRARRGH